MKVRWLKFALVMVVMAVAAVRQSSYASDAPNTFDLGTKSALSNQPVVDLHLPFWQQDWIITLSSDLSFGPSYAQPNSFFGIIPSVDFRKAGEPEDFSSPDDGFGPTLLDLGWLKAGPAFQYVNGRFPSHHSRLHGLDKVNWTLEAGGFVELWPTQFLRTRLDLRQGINGHRGMEGALAMDFVQSPGKFMWAIGPRLKFASQRYVNAFYSVSPAQALANGTLTPYTAHSGLTAVGAIASVEYLFAPQWSGTLYSSYDYFIGSAGNSPITQKLGVGRELTIGFVLSRSFTLHGL